VRRPLHVPAGHGSGSPLGCGSRAAFQRVSVYPPTLDLKIRSNVTRASAPVDVLFCSSAIAVRPGSGNRTLPPNWVVSACMRVSTADTIPYAATRSEEHTSELQSPDHLVC